MTTNYQQQAIEALKTLNTKMTIKLSNTKKAPWAPLHEGHYHYLITLSNENGKYTFDFFGSQKDYEDGKTEITQYDVLACLEYYTPEKFEDFCSEFGYEQDSIKAKKTWKSCLTQSQKLNELFPEESQKQLLSEIR